jgi:carboxyl-terminal processing protease
LKLGSLAVAVLALVTYAGSGWARERYLDLQVFAKVLNLVQQYYVEEVDTRKLIQGGIKGMLQELDPHTNYLSPELFRDFENETSGEFGGLGIEITVQNDILTIISPIEDTPAWEAGIQAGDRVVEINGESTKGMSLAEAAQRMRGKMGSKVTLGIYREGFDKPKDFVITRGVVKVKSVKSIDFDEGYLYIRLTSFIENSAAEVERAIKAVLEKHQSIKGLIVDVRRNPGGLLEQAVRISDLFLESGTIVSTIGRDKSQVEVTSAKKEGTYLGFPIVVLVNEFSASASEILAGALQDNRRALVMGQQTFGKGSVQSVVKLGDGSALKLTVARYYTPNGRSIQAEGIKPDVMIEEVDAEAYRKAVIKRDIRREQDIAGHLIGDKEKKELEAKRQQSRGAEDDLGLWYKQPDSAKKAKLTPKEKLLNDDFQVLQAYNYLRAWSVMSQFGLDRGALPAPPLSPGKPSAAVPAAAPSLGEPPPAAAVTPTPVPAVKPSPSATPRRRSSGGSAGKPATAPKPSPAKSPPSSAATPVGKPSSPPPAAASPGKTN